MPYVCAVFGCSNRSNRETNRSYFRVPREIIKKGERVKDFTKRRREMWLANLWLGSKGAESKHARICSDHFVKGCPSNLYDENDIDWAPTKKLGHDRVKQPTDERAQSQQENRKRSEGAEALLELHQVMRTKTPELQDIQEPDVKVDEKTNTVEIRAQDASCQTDLTANIIVGIEEELQRRNSELYELRSKALDMAMSKESFKKSEEKTKFYTGLPNFLVLMQVFSLCEPYIITSTQSALDKFEQLILVLMRLRLNLPLLDLAYRFGISQPTASRIWHKVLAVLHQRLEFVCRCPEQDMLRATIPIEFRQSLSGVYNKQTHRSGPLEPPIVLES